MSFGSLSSCNINLHLYRTYLVDPIIEGSINFFLLNQMDVQSSESTDYGQLFIEPDDDVFETINWVPSSREKLCLVCC